MKLNEINFKISSFCNMDCFYCYQSKKDRSNSSVFDLYDELIKFCLHIQLDDTLLVKVTGGEASLFCNEIENACNKIRKLERHTDTKVKFAMTSNGFNMDGILDLIDRGYIVPEDTKISWDGHSILRRSRSGEDLNAHYMKQILKLGNSKFGNTMRVRTAITPESIYHLDEIIEFLVENGCTFWEYYYLDNCKSYLDKNFVELFRTKLNKIMKLYSSKKFSFVNYDNKDTLLKEISYCKNVDHSIAINHDGNVYMCLGNIQTNRSLGNLKERDYDTILARFSINANSINRNSSGYKLRDNMHCGICRLDINESNKEYCTGILNQTHILKLVECDIFGLI